MPPAENGSNLTSANGLESLREDCQSLRSVLYLVTISTIILAGSLFVFLLREVSLVRRQLQDLRQFKSSYETTSLPMMEDFRVQLEGFAETHPDFLPLLRRYISSTNGVESPAGIPVAPPPGPDGTSPANPG